MKNNNDFVNGIADVWYDGKRDLWVEYKFLKVPKRDTTVVDLCGGKAPALSHMQQHWLEQRWMNGRNVAVIVGCTEGGVVLVDKAWELPMTAGVFKAAVVSRKALAEWIVERTG